MKAAIPVDERQRLATLRDYEILDSEPEQAFDDLAMLAAQICQVPMATVSFVDGERQWFKSRVGVSVTETSREAAFCAHTILDAGSVLVVRDAQTDPRFFDSPLVTSEPHIRFYAGAPLIAPDGQAVGALCVMDRTPRTLTAEQVVALRTLSRHVVAQLELRRQARQLENEIAVRRAAEAWLQERFEHTADSEQEASRQLMVAERSRRALLSVLEDEKRSGQKLRDSEERFRQLAENINEVFWMTDPATATFLYVSPAYETIWGRSCESLVSNPLDWFEAIHPADRARVIEAASTRQASGDYDETYRVLRPDGSQRWVRDRAFPVRDEGGDVYRMVGTAEDITTNKHAELLTGVQHAVTEVLSEAAPLSETVRRILQIICRRLEWELGDVWTVDRTTRTLRCVDLWHPPSTEFREFAEASRTLEFAPGEGLPGRVFDENEPRWVADVTQESWFARRLQAAAPGLRGALAFPIRMRGHVFGVVEFFSSRSRPPDMEMVSMLAAIGTQIGQFIERKQLEDQFRQAQKMEAIGTLAGGIAHDFNNILAAIIGYTDLARKELHDNPDVEESLAAISEGSQRAVELVRQILAFSRQQEHAREPIQLWPIVDEALRLLRASVPVSITFDISGLRQGPMVLADRTQIHQIIMNLATNAAHAMGNRPGRLGVSLEDVEVDADLAALHPGLGTGRHLRLCITDTGHGMDRATLNRIFDPFFTTKAPGEGTGLGLAVVHGIVQSHDAVITVYSQPGEGTSFQLYFPAHAGELLEPARPAAETPRGRGERILIIDDEAPMALLGKRILERLGYLVDAHTVPADAITALLAEPNGFDLVLTDLSMPGMSGTDLAEQVLGIRPDIPIILTTGYTAALTLERVRAMGIRKLLLKPLTMHALGEAVHGVITEMKNG